MNDDIKVAVTFANAVQSPMKCFQCLREGKRVDATWTVSAKGYGETYSCDKHANELMEKSQAKPLAIEGLFRKVESNER